MKIEIIRGTVTTVRRGLEASGLRACWAPFRQKKCLFSFVLSLASFYPLIVGEGYCCTRSYSVTHTRLDSAGRGIGPSHRPLRGKTQHSRRDSNPQSQQAASEHTKCHHHHRHWGLDPLIRSVSTVTTALSNVSSIFQLFSFLVVCSGMI